MLNYEEKHDVEVKMRPVCECGHVFKELYYNKRNNSFAPRSCPNCNRPIATFTFVDPSKRSPNEDGDISLTD